MNNLSFRRLVQEVRRFADSGVYPVSSEKEEESKPKDNNTAEEILQLENTSVSLAQLMFLADMSEAVYKSDWSWFESSQKQLHML